MTTSHEAAGNAAREVPRSALQTMDEGDAMAASAAQAASARDELLQASQRPVPAMQACLAVSLRHAVLLRDIAQGGIKMPPTLFAA